VGLNLLLLSCGVLSEFSGNPISFGRVGCGGGKLCQFICFFEFCRLKLFVVLVKLQK
jgi:hypothetical protein